MQLVRSFHSQHSHATLLQKGESRIAKGKDKRKDSYRKTALTVVKGRGNTLFDIQGAAKARSASGNDWLGYRIKKSIDPYQQLLFCF